MVRAGPAPGEPLEVSVSALPQLEKLPFTLQQCVMFRMVARLGSVKDAAMALNLSSRAVYKSIAALEQVPTPLHLASRPSSAAHVPNTHADGSVSLVAYGIDLTL